MMVKRIIVIAIIAVIATGAVTFYYLYNKPQRDVASLDAKVVSAKKLYSDFSTNEQQANTSYLNKAVQVNGKVIEVKKNQSDQPQVVLDTGDPIFGVACTMDNNLNNIRPGDEVTIKGICTGYLNDVIIIRSLLLK